MASYELQNLLKHYGVGTASGSSGYASPSEIVDPSAADYQELMNQYGANTDAQKDWMGKYGEHMQTSMYGNGWQGDTLDPLLLARLAKSPTDTPVDTGMDMPTVDDPAKSLRPNSQNGGGNSYSGGFNSMGESNPESLASDAWGINKYGIDVAVDPTKAAMGTLLAGPLGALYGIQPSLDPLGKFAYDQLVAQEQRDAQAKAEAEAAAAAQAQAQQAAAAQAAAQLAATQAATGNTSSSYGSNYGGNIGSGGITGGGAQSSFGSGSVQGSPGSLGMNGGSYGGGGGTNSDGGTGDTGSDGGGGGMGSGGGGTGGTNSDGGTGDTGSDGVGGGWAMGGLVRKYAESGPVEEDPSPYGQGLDMLRVTPAQLDMMRSQDPQAMERGIQRFYGQPQETLPQMAQAYASPEMDMYAQEYQDARKRAAEDRGNFEKLLQATLDRKTSPGPSKAEMYFQLASAFGAPTKTGAFTESLGNANQVLGAHQKALREAETANLDRRDQMALDIAKYRAEGSKDDVTSLRGLTVEEMKARRLANMPLSEIGKALSDAGLRPGTPAYAEAMTRAVALQEQNKQPAPHYLTGPSGEMLAAGRGNVAVPITDAAGNALISPDYQEPPTNEPILGVPVPAVTPWANQSNRKNADKVRASEVARGAKEIEADNDAAKAALLTAQSAERFKALNAKIDTGSLPDKTRLGQWIQSFGPEYQDMLSIAAKLTPGLRAPGSGSTSDFDAKMFKEGTVGVDKPRQTNENIANGYIQQAKIAQDYADFRATYLEQNGTLQGANQHWNSYINKNPIFDPKSPNVPIMNDRREDWRSFFAKRTGAADKPSAAPPVTDFAAAAAAELARRKGGR